MLKGNVQEIERLLRTNKNLDINVLSNDGVTPLIYASLNNHIDVVRLLLQKDARTDIQEENGWTALMHATIKRFVLQLFSLLLGICCRIVYSWSLNKVLPKKEKYFAILVCLENSFNIQYALTN